MWKQREVVLENPADVVEVEKFAKPIEKPSNKVIASNVPVCFLLLFTYFHGIIMSNLKDKDKRLDAL